MSSKNVPKVATSTPHLTGAQKRHLIEMLVPDPCDPPMVWTTRRGSAQYRCAMALVKKGLVELLGDHSSWSFNNPPFILTERGLEVAEALRG